MQPDSLCKLKTSLAINYIKDILETNQSISVQKISSKSLKKGHLKPLLVVNQLIEPPITRCLGIQNGKPYQEHKLALNHDSLVYVIMIIIIIVITSIMKL